MASSLADLYVELSLKNDKFTRGLEESAAAGEAFGEKYSRAAKDAEDASRKLADQEKATADEASRSAGAWSRLTGKLQSVRSEMTKLASLGGDNSSLGSKLAAAADKAKGFGPAWLGPVLALAPAATSLLGVTATAAIGLGGAFATAGAATAAYGLVAKSVLTRAATAASAVQTAQVAYNSAIATGTKQSTAYAAEQAAILTAYAGMSPAQIELSKELGGISGQWQNFEASVTPLIAGSLQPWLHGVGAAIRSLRTLITPMAPVVHGLGVQFDTLMGSSTMKSFMAWIGTTGASVTGSLGNAVMDLLTSMTFLLPQFTPLIKGAAGAISRWGDAFVRWSSSQKAANEIRSFLAWFHTNGPLVGTLLRNVGGALKALAPGLSTGATTELQLVSGFLGFIAKLPPSLAKPLLDVAGVLLTLNKLGVISTGLKLTFPKEGAGKSALAASLGMKLLGGALIVPATVMIIGSIIPKDTSRQAAADFKKQPGIVVKVSDFLHTEGMGAWVDQYFSHPVRAWAENSLPHFLGVARHDIASTFDTIRHSVASAWDTTWNNTVRRVQRGVSDVTRFVGTLPGRILGALRALPGEMLTLGRNIVEGLIHGIEDMAGSAVHAALSVGSSIWSGLKTFFKVGSPSKLMEDLGLDIGRGLVQGLEGSKSSVKSSADKLATYVREAFNAKDIGLGTANSLTGMIQRDNTKLQDLANKRAKILKEIATAKKYATTTAQAAESQYGVVNAAGGGSTPATAASILATLQTNLTSIRAFKSNIQKLAKMGLNKAYISQIIAAGPVDGGQIAQELASGSWSQIQQINTVEKQITSASTSLGKTAANAMYDTGKDAGKGFLSGLQHQQKSIEDVMKRIARAMVATIRKELGIRSPSTVMHQHGLDAARGFALGIQDGIAETTAASARLAGAVSSGAAPGGAGAGGRGQVSQTFHITVNGYIGNEEQLVSKLLPPLQKIVLEVDRINPGTGNGLSLGSAAGRAA